MKITIVGTRICLSGSFRHHSHGLMARRIRAAGGVFSNSLSGRTDVLAHGAGLNAKLTDARTRGIPIIDAAQLEALIAGEEIEVADLDAGGEVELGDALGEARSILDGPVDSRTWSRIIALVDGCDPERLPSLVDFLEPQLDRWNVPRHVRWRPDTSLASMEDAPDDWIRSMPYGFLCVAPFRWVVEMNTKRHSPKHRLARAISTLGMKMTTAATRRLLSNPHLTNLRSFDLGGVDATPRIWELLRSSPSTLGLEHLGVSLGSEAQNGVEGAHHLGTLRCVTLRGYGFQKMEAMSEVFASSWGQDVRELVLTRSTHADALSLLGDASTLPSLERVVLDWLAPHEVSRIMGRLALQRVEEVTVRTSLAPVSQNRNGLIRATLSFFVSLTPARAYGPNTLDLSEVELSPHAAREGWELEPALYAALRTWSPADAIRRIRLGPHRTPRLVGAIEAMGIEPV